MLKEALRALLHAPPLLRISSDCDGTAKLPVCGTRHASAIASIKQAPIPLICFILNIKKCKNNYEFFACSSSSYF
jgi:hypothetical protein